MEPKEKDGEGKLDADGSLEGETVGSATAVAEKSVKQSASATRKIFFIG
jgi:hypothetical protein